MLVPECGGRGSSVVHPWARGGLMRDSLKGGQGGQIPPGVGDHPNCGWGVLSVKAIYSVGSLVGC
jgi:hypothetical protein